MDIVLERVDQASSWYIYVYNREWGDIKQIKEVLKILHMYRLTANPKKCVWGVAEVEYLGYKVGKGKVRVPELRVRELKTFLKPKKTTVKSHIHECLVITNASYQGWPNPLLRSQN